jgi:hypothetical protein
VSCFRQFSLKSGLSLYPSEAQIIFEIQFRVLLFDGRPFSFEDLQSFYWESPISDRIKRLKTNSQPDFDE